MLNSKAKDEFLGRLKDPYYGRPIYLRPDIPVGATFSITVEKTGEIVNFVNTLYDDMWAMYGTNCKHQQLTARQVETRVLDYIIVAQRQKGHIVLIDTMFCLVINKRESIISQYV